ncbi:MAG: DUF4236 domain-containing protein [Treponema sp.]|nr:DUF4236 domain-containing protein [Treponema sp.]
MGFRFRKSINLGAGFRINLSKSGIGYSWGVPGYRITKTANGKTRKSYSIPGTGLGYVEESSNEVRKNNSTVSEQSSRDVVNTIYDSNKFSSVRNIETASINNFQSEEYKLFLRQIKFRLFFKCLFAFFSYFVIYIIFCITIQI